MEGVPFAPGEVKCVICGAGFKKYQTLVWHRMRKHKTTRRQEGGGRMLPLPGGATGASGPGSSARGLVGGGSSHPLQSSPPPHPPPPPLNTANGVANDEEGGGSPEDAGHLPPPPTAPGAAGEGTLGADSPTDSEALPPPQRAASSGFFFMEDAVQEAVDAMDAVIMLTRRSKKPVGPAPKRRKASNGDAESTATGWDYNCLSHDIREHYEAMKDWDAHTPLLTKRKACHPGRFNSYRLRLVQRFALECGGGGMSLLDQEKFFHVLDAWDRTKAGMPVDAGHYLGIRDTFNSGTDFKNALADDIDDAIEDEGWMKCTMVEGGESFKVIFRSALDVALERMRAADNVKLWSGGDRPAPPSNKREDPMDGDAFRLCEAAVIRDNDEDSFVLGLHAFSDASRLSSSGGKSCVKGREVGDRARGYAVATSCASSTASFGLGHEF